MAQTGQTNGYISLTTLVQSLLAVTLSLASIGGTILTISIGRVNDRLEAHEKRLDLYQQEIVPWQVHLEKWNAQAAEDARLQSDIKSLDDKIGGTYNMRDELQRMQSQLDCLQAGVCKTQVGKPNGP